MIKRITFSLLALVLSIAQVSCNNKPEENGEDLTTIPEGDYVNRKAEFGKLPGWKFRCKVYAEAQTVEDYGGEIEFKKKMDKLLADASEYFCVKGINDAGGNQMHFYMTDMVIFEGQSKRYMYDDKAIEDTSFDLRIIVNGHAEEGDVSGGWLGAPYLAVGHDFEGLFEGHAIDALVHELGHSRGMADIYATEVREANQNIISGQTFEGIKGIMNNCYGEREWSEYSLMMINASADRRVAYEHHDFIPQGIKATVKKTDGSIATGAYLKFYPVYPYSYKVSTTPLYEGKLSVTGNFIFDGNPFIEKGQSKDKNIFNYLVEIEYDDKRSYAWMPIYEAELAGLNKQDPHTIVFTIDKNASEIDSNDYINRKLVFDALPGWKFRCKVYAEKRTVEDNGGRIEFMKKMDQLMETASKYFQVPGLNDEGDNQIHFFMSDMEIFEGQSRQHRYTNGESDLSYDMRVVVNAHTDANDVGGGWLGPPYLSVGHDYKDGLWQGYGVDALVHEFGHTRGVPDLYGMEVEAAKNPINKKGFEATNCIMNYPYGNTVWSNYAKMIINNSKDERIGILHHSMKPSTTKVQVLKSDGSAASGAHVKFYPVYSYSYAVESTALFEGDVNQSGIYTFSEYPFMKPSVLKVNKEIFNYLVEVQYNGNKTYKWMPLYEAELAAGPECKPFTFTVKL